MLLDDAVQPDGPQLLLVLRLLEQDLDQSGARLAAVPVVVGPLEEVLEGPEGQAVPQVHPQVGVDVAEPDHQLEGQPHAQPVLHLQRRRRAQRVEHAAQRGHDRDADHLGEQVHGRGLRQRQFRGHQVVQHVQGVQHLLLGGQPEAQQHVGEVVLHQQRLPQGGAGLREALHGLQAVEVGLHHHLRGGPGHLQRQQERAERPVVDQDLLVHLELADSVQHHDQEVAGPQELPATGQLLDLPELLSLQLQGVQLLLVRGVGLPDGREAGDDAVCLLREEAQPPLGDR
mmetsp:Transcript_119377/g.207809  ORF Transcript_119377/g.207809 Transcript_119377/m.207809 type:complete len:286 (+) Transcript_119377:1753-2610(+)